MIRLLTFSLALYWAAFFALHALSLLAQSGQGVQALAGFADSGFPGLLAGIAVWPDTIIIFLVLFTLTASLFLRVALSALMLPGDPSRHYRDTGGPAFASAILGLVLVLIAASFNPATALFQSLGVAIAGLAASYAVFAAERITKKSEEICLEGKNVARIMALDAAHNALLARFSGRDKPNGRGRI